MASQPIRVAVLRYLDQLPGGTSVHPIDLALQLGLTAEQVNPFLESAQQNNEIEVSSDGSVQIATRLKGQFSGGASPGKVPVFELAILKEAIQRVPQLKYAFAVTGVVAAAVIVLFFVLGYWPIAIFGFVGVLLGMILLRIFVAFVPKASRVDMTRQVIVLSWLAVLVLATLAVIGLVWITLQAFRAAPVTMAPPKEFPVHTVRFSYGLPEGLFGGIGDPARPRQWLERLDESARGLFGEDAEVVWLYTDAFTDSHGDFTAFIYVGTEAPLEIGAFVFTRPMVHNPLAASHGQGQESEYRFRVQHSQAGQRIVVWLAMSANTYRAFHDDHNFRIRSEPFQPDA